MVAVFNLKSRLRLGDAAEVRKLNTLFLLWYTSCRGLRFKRLEKAISLDLQSHESGMPMALSEYWYVQKLKVCSSTRGCVLHLFQMPPVFFDSFGTCLAHLAVTKRIRIPSFETFLLCCGWVAHTLCAVRLEYHGLEGASCGRHRADMSLMS